MRLPLKNELKNNDHLYLFNHDLKEMHSKDKSSIERILYKEHRELVLKIIEDGIERKNTKVLDVACAQGNYSIALAEMGYTVFATDINMNFLTYANIKDDKNLVEFISCNAFSMPFKESSFDLIILGELLEHVAYPENLVDYVSKFLKKDGFLLITTPNGSNLLNKLPNLSDISDRETLIEKQFGPDAKDHLFLLTKEECFGILKLLNFTIIDFYFGKTLLINRYSKFIFKYVPDHCILLFENFIANLPKIGCKISQGQYILAQKN
jgi:2-polyprenyl-3-methyl-5-hydroxy-6-metoxy-1,4-benzoquinol methylase